MIRQIIEQSQRLEQEGPKDGRTWWPVWLPIGGRYPWRLVDQGGKHLCRPWEGRVPQAYSFVSAQKALAFLKSSEGKKAVASQE